MSANFAYLNTRDLKFIAKEWLPTEKIFSYPRYSEYYSKDDVDAILDPCLKMAKELIEPTNEDGDSNPIQFENGKVKLPQALGRCLIQLQSKDGNSNIDESEGAMVCRRSVCHGYGRCLCCQFRLSNLYIILPVVQLDSFRPLVMTS